MNSQAFKIAAFAIAGVILFAASFFLFAVLSGTPLDELALVGKMFAQPEHPEGELLPDPEPDVTIELQDDRRPNETVLHSATTPLQAFLLQSPYSTDELEALQEQLKAQIRANEAREIELDTREREIVIREQHIEDRWNGLVEIRDSLNERELELAQRDDELERDAAAAAERERQSWSDMASIFAEGKAKDLSSKLLAIDPTNAALILRALTPERARELMQVLSGEDFKRYMTAYREAGM